MTDGQQKSGTNLAGAHPSLPPLARYQDQQGVGVGPKSCFYSLSASADTYRIKEKPRVETPAGRSGGSSYEGPSSWRRLFMLGLREYLLGVVPWGC